MTNLNEIITSETLTDIKESFKYLFPLSHIAISKGCLGSNNYFVTCYLQRPDEWSNKISQNDPLNYMFRLDSDGFKELNLSLTIKPESKYLCYSSAKMRKSSSKVIDVKKITRRFEKLKQFIIDNLDKTCDEHHISEKVKLTHSGKQIEFSDNDFNELFELDDSFELEIDTDTHTKITNYMQVSNEGYSSLKVRPSEKVIDWIIDRFIHVNYDSISFKAIDHKNGKSLIVATYSQILGSHYLGYINTSSIPQEAS